MAQDPKDPEDILAKIDAMPTEAVRDLAKGLLVSSIAKRKHRSFEDAAKPRYLTKIESTKLGVVAGAPVGKLSLGFEEDAPVATVYSATFAEAAEVERKLGRPPVTADWNVATNGTTEEFLYAVQCALGGLRRDSAFMDRNPGHPKAEADGIALAGGISFALRPVLVEAVVAFFWGGPFWNRPEKTEQSGPNAEGSTTTTPGA